MIRLLPIPLLCAAICAAQSPYMPAYQGMQPELVEGVEDGLATAKPKIRHLYMAGPGVLGIVLHAQAIPRVKVEPYVREPGDRIVGRTPAKVGAEGRTVYRYQVIFRNNLEYGTLLGRNGEFYAPKLKLLGQKLDYAWADAVGSYALTSEDDANYTDPVEPERVARKTFPEMQEWVQVGGLQSTYRHEIFLKLPNTLTAGSRYRLTWRGNHPFSTDSVSFTFDDTRLRTEAIHVNQHGHHPRETEKLAFVSMWLGDMAGVDFSSAEEFRVVDDSSGEVRFTGPVRLRRAGLPGKQMGTETERPITDHLPMSVWQLDFSSFDQPGRYRIVVPGLGSSFPFRIDDAVWTDAAKISAHGYLNQRASIELGPPYTRYVRPRMMHPEDGFRAHFTDPGVFFDVSRFPARSGVSNPFDRIQASLLEHTHHPGAWGGWQDAADFDRSLMPQNHPRAVHAMLELFESNPAYFENLSLNLPESGNGIPDLLNEALWCMDLFLRIQQEDGGVPSAVESIEHPGEPSWLLTQPTGLTPPTPEANRIYAAAAARLAIALYKYDPARADRYRESADRAMAWVSANRGVPELYARSNWEIIEAANLAAVWMYRLTGSQQWHDEFKSTLRELHGDGRVRLDRTRFTGGPWGVAAYALLSSDEADPAVRERCRQAFLASADEKVSAVARWPFGIHHNPADYDKRLGDSWDLVIAHRITGDSKYLLAMSRMAQYAMGANPANASQTSGMGSRQMTVFNLDAYDLGVALPEGITIYGPYYRYSWHGGELEKALTGIHPEYKNWPWAESVFNLRYPPMTEYTVGGVMANQLLMRGYVAQSIMEPTQ